MLIRRLDNISKFVRTNLERGSSEECPPTVDLPINSVPSPFINSDCHFWFERGIKNLAGSTVGVTNAIPPLQWWQASVQEPVLFFPYNSDYTKTGVTNVSPGSSSMLRFDADGAFSIWWYQLSHALNYHCICSRDGISPSSTREWNFTYTKDGGSYDGKTLFTAWDSSGAAILRLAGNTDLNTWTHWVINYSHASATFTLYKNGSSVASGSPSGSYNATSQLVGFGGFSIYSSFNYPGNGYCSQFIGFNRKLTTTEIATLYNSGGGLFSI